MKAEYECPCAMAEEHHARELAYQVHRCVRNGLFEFGLPASPLVYVFPFEGEPQIVSIRSGVNPMACQRSHSRDGEVVGTVAVFPSSPAQQGHEGLAIRGEFRTGRERWLRAHGDLDFARDAEGQIVSVLDKGLVFERARSARCCGEEERGEVAQGALPDDASVGSDADSAAVC